jgi:hypothetical protein
MTMRKIESAARARRRRPGILSATILGAAVSLGGCYNAPLMPYSEDNAPLALLPVTRAGVEDRRDRFREIFCAVLEARGPELPDYRPCDEALTRVGTEPAGSGKPVALGQSDRRLVAAIVPGIGWDCFAEWMDLKHSVAAHVGRFGYGQVLIPVDALSSSANNARQIRDAILSMKSSGANPDLVLIGYSKGVADILESAAAYPEIRARIAAVVSAAGAVGGSPLANDATQDQAELMRYWPGAQCSVGDNGALESLRPSTRQAWLAENALPRDFPYYSLVTFPQPEHISSVLEPSYDKLSQVDARNDGQVLFYDQVIPGSSLLGYLNADHFAVAVPIERSHPTIGSIFIDHNRYPREALLEAVLRFIEEDLAASGK